MRTPASRQESASDSFDALCRLKVLEIAHTRSAIGRRIREFGLTLMVSPPSLSRAKQLIFLCGANQSENVPSERRAAVKKFIGAISPTNTVIYAEGIFNEIAKFGHQSNALDVEHEISEIADKIIIILESESAFCELGAFAHKALREKLIIINNSQFKDSKSFINTGPIAAALEAKAPVIWYKMSDNGHIRRDGIGATFTELRKALEHAPTRVAHIPFSKLSELGLNKASLYFVHDIVLFTGPVRLEELITILKIIFPRTAKKNFESLKSILGILREGQLLKTKKVGDKWVYQATSTDTFLRYSKNVSGMRAAFREHHFKNEPERYNLE